MKFNIIDTQAIYQRLLVASSDAEREAIFRAELVAPFEGLAQIFTGGDGLASFRQWGMWPEQFAPNSPIAQVIDTLAAHDAWYSFEQALDDGYRAFEPYLSQIPTEMIHCALLVGDMGHQPLQRGYTGFGGIPGYLMTFYEDPNDYNLPRLKGAWTLYIYTSGASSERQVLTIKSSSRRLSPSGDHVARLNTW